VAALLVATHAIAAVAYGCGTVGTIIGADVLNLPRFRSGPAVDQPEATEDLAESL
jgi:uncharacterized membrane protein